MPGDVEHGPFVYDGAVIRVEDMETKSVAGLLGGSEWGGGVHAGPARPLAR